MPRKPRIQYAGAVYHVISRGQRREAIVWDDADRVRFVETMGEGCERMGWMLHAWVLMSNHYHWLLETPVANLVTGMQWFQTTWSTRFRVRHQLSGHVLQGRYKAHVVDPESESYFRSLSSYIHLNPVRAHRVLAPDQRLETYRWSSYPDYLKAHSRRPEWLEVGRVLGNLGLGDSASGRKAYREYLRKRVAEVRDVRAGRERNDIKEEWEALRNDWCLGDADFRGRMLERVGVLMDERGEAYSGAAVREHGENQAVAWIEEGMRAFEVSRDELEGMKKTDGRKQVLAWLVRRHTSVRNRWVSEQLRMGHEVNVSQAVRKVEGTTSGELKELKSKLLRRLKSKA